MELRTTRELRRNERLSKAMAKKAEADAPTPAQPAQKQPPADKLTLSRQALSFLEELPLNFSWPHLSPTSSKIGRAHV